MTLETGALRAAFGATTWIPLQRWNFEMALGRRRLLRPGTAAPGGAVSKCALPKPGVRLKVGEGEAEAERGSATRSKLERKIGVVKPAASRAGGRAAGHRPALRKSSRQTIPLPSVLTHF